MQVPFNVSVRAVLSVYADFEIENPEELADCLRYLKTNCENGKVVMINNGLFSMIDIACNNPSTYIYPYIESLYPDLDLVLDEKWRPLDDFIKNEEYIRLIQRQYPVSFTWVGLKKHYDDLASDYESMKSIVRQLLK